MWATAGEQYRTLIFKFLIPSSECRSSPKGALREQFEFINGNTYVCARMLESPTPRLGALHLLNIWATTELSRRQQPL